jgi:eukaryotic-like serine/threonine-protein kinase
MSLALKNLWQFLAGSTGGVQPALNNETRPQAAEAGESRPSIIGSRFGAYVLRERLGSGGMGEVYLAEHQRLGRRAAIKLIRTERQADPQAIARFESEARTTANLTHPNTVEVYDFGVAEDGTLYYAMEFLPGMNLQEIVERTGPMPAARVIHLLQQACSALQEAHAQGLVHRDIKPANLFATQQGGTSDVTKVLDFGLVKSTQALCDDVQATHDGVMLGSPLYAAPELTQGDHRIDARTDIYSLGATAYFLLTGRPVFPGENALAVLFAHVTKPAPLVSEFNAGIPAELEAIVLKCLAKRPDDRFASAADLEQALAACAEELPWAQSEAAECWQSIVEVGVPLPSADVDVYSETAVVPLVAA